MLGFFVRKRILSKSMPPTSQMRKIISMTSPNKLCFECFRRIFYMGQGIQINKLRSLAQAPYIQYGSLFFNSTNGGRRACFFGRAFAKEGCLQRWKGPRLGHGAGQAGLESYTRSWALSGALRSRAIDWSILFICVVRDMARMIIDGQLAWCSAKE